MQKTEKKLSRATDRLLTRIDSFAEENQCSAKELYKTQTMEIIKLLSERLKPVTNLPPPCIGGAKRLLQDRATNASLAGLLCRIKTAPSLSKIVTTPPAKILAPARAANNGPRTIKEIRQRSEIGLQKRAVKRAMESNLVTSYFRYGKWLKIGDLQGGLPHDVF